MKKTIEEYKLKENKRIKKALEKEEQMDKLVEEFLKTLPEYEVKHYKYTEEYLRYKIHKSNGFIKWLEEKK